MSLRRRNVTVEEKHGSKEEQSVLNAVVLVKKFEAVKLEEETTAAAFAAGIHLVGLVDVTPEGRKERFMENAYCCALE